MPKLSQRLLQELRDLYEEFLVKLGPRDRDAIMKHLEGPYGGTLDDAPLPGSGEYGSPELGQQLEDIMRRGPRTPFDMTVWRGSRLPGFERTRPDVNYPYSTAVSPEGPETYAEGWSYGAEHEGKLDDVGHLTEIEVPKGSPGIYLPESERLPMFPFGEELEFLIPRGELVGPGSGVLKRSRSTGPRFRKTKKRYLPPFCRGGAYYEGAAR